MPNPYYIQDVDPLWWTALYVLLNNWLVQNINQVLHKRNYMSKPGEFFTYLVCDKHAEYTCSRQKYTCSKTGVYIYILSDPTRTSRTVHVKPKIISKVDLLFKKQDTMTDI